MWDDAMSQTTATATGLSAGTYSVTVSDSNNCNANANTTILSDTVNPVISGAVYLAGSPVTAGVVALVTYNSNPTQMTVAATTTLDGFGNYVFFGIISDDYLIIAEADTAVYPNTVATYHDSTNHWQMATIITAGCSDTITNIDIALIDFPTTIGFGSIGGNLQQGGPFKAAGSPLEGALVSLEESPSGIVKDGTTTNASGDFEFTNVSDGQYVLYVDIPGLGMDSTYTVNVSSSTGDTIFTNLNFHIDTTPGSGQIYIDTNTATGIIGQYAAINSILTVFPNPFTDLINIECTLSDMTHIILEVYNVFGEKIETLYQGEQSAGNVKYTFNIKDGSFSSGMYFVKLSINGKIQVQRVISIE
ncbi:MAG: hypothetical protein COA57_16210 [Flavobacteriales bacterium]|nr:MAG: hypothetical protein COA57_16210 [Flavobacteriales bacterium]